MRMCAQMLCYLMKIALCGARQSLVMRGKLPNRAYLNEVYLLTLPRAAE